MAVTLSDKAAKHVANYLTKRGKGVGLRLGVRTSGCSGMAYKLEFVDEVSPEAVSYTHLDVYKRQSLWPERRCGAGA